MGRDADAQSCLVAATGPRRAQDLPRLPDRSRARLLPDLRVPVATRSAIRNFFRSPGTKCCERTGGAIPQFYPRDDSTWENCEANRREGEEYLRMVLEAAGDTRVVGEDLGNGAALCAAEFAVVRHRRFQDSAVGESRRRPDRSRAANISGFPSRPTRRTITNRFAPCGRKRWTKQLRGERTSARDLRKIAEFAGIPPRRRSRLSIAIFMRRS